jgi:hypothetical protein
MSEFEAYSAADDVLGWKSESAARLRDILARDLVARNLPDDSAGDASASTWSRKLEKLWHLFERGVGSSLSLGKVRQSLTALRALLSRDAAKADDAPVEDEVLALQLRVLQHRQAESIENYPAYLFQVKVKI